MTWPCDPSNQQLSGQQPSEPPNPYDPPRPYAPPPPAYQQPAPQPQPYGAPPSQQPYPPQPYPPQPYGQQAYGQQQPYPPQPFYGQPYGQPAAYGPPPYLPPPPPRRSRSLPWLIAAGVLVAVAIMVAAAIPTFRQSLATCGSERAPVGASAPAAAYVRAVNAAYPGWHSMSQTIADQGHKVYAQQLSQQIQTDQSFVADLKGITFTPKQQPAAAALIESVNQYDAFLQVSLENPGYLGAHQTEDQTLNNSRAAASAELRRVLGLPSSRCSYNRP